MRDPRPTATDRSASASVSLGRPPEGLGLSGAGRQAAAKRASRPRVEGVPVSLQRLDRRYADRTRKDG